MEIRGIVVLFLLVLLSVSSSSAQEVFSDWQDFYQVWDSLEHADDTYFDYLDVEEWKAEFDQLQVQYPGMIDSTEQFLRDYLEAYFIFFLSDYTRSIPLYIELLSDRSRLTNNQLKWCLVNLEESYRRTGNLKEAIPITKQRVELGFDDDFFHIYEEAGLFREAIVEYMEHNDLPTAPIRAQGYYSRIARLLKQDGQLDSAIYYYKLAYQEGLQIIDKEDYPGKSVYHHRLRKYYTHQMRGEIGLIYIEQGKYGEAIPYLEKDIATCKEVNELALQVPKRLGLAESFLALGERDIAKLHLDTAWRINKETDWVVHDIKYMQIAGKYYFEIGKFDSAAILFQKSNLLSDSISAIQRENKLIATTAFLDNERQGKVITKQRFELEQAQLAQAQQREQLVLLLAGSAIVLLLTIFFYLDAKRKKKAKDIALRDKETILRQAEELKEMDKVKTRFFANISHEFRTPLTLIEGPIKSILQGKVTEEKDKVENLQVAERNAQTLRNLIDEVLDFNKMETGEILINRKPVLLLDWLSELIENYQFLCKQRGIELKAQTQLQSNTSVLLDPLKVEHILNNLISNASKYARNVIGLELRHMGSQFSMVVTDDGPGIPDEEITKVFDRFYQTKHGQQLPHSSGIGLAYVKEIVSLMGGTVEVRSKVGQGTIFTLSIPAEESNDWRQEESVEILPEYAPGPYPHPNNDLLIVEDNAEMRNYIQQVVGQEFNVKICANGAEALEILADFEPDLIISDVMMPVMDGIELLKQVKEREFSKPISFVMLTARQSHELKLEALSLGLDDYLTKPFSPLELEIRVKNLLKNQFERIKWLSEEPEIEEVIEDPFVEDLKSTVIEHLADKQFGVVTLAEMFHMSDRQLTRVTRKTTGMSPAAFIREVRLVQSLEILTSGGRETVTEVAEMVGLGRASHFTKIFFERYGRKPSQYLKKQPNWATKG